MIRVHLIVSGFVQGVGFRYFVKQKADELGLTGWVKNTPASPDSRASRGGEDGNVEVLVEGDEEKLKEIVAICKEGPPPASVKNVSVEKSEATGEFKEFNITYQ